MVAVALTRIEPPLSQRVLTARNVSGNVNLTDAGSFYEALAPGHHRVTVVATARGVVHITNSMSTRSRYLSQDLDEQRSGVVEVTVPKGAEHYLNVWLHEQGDVRVAMEHLAAP